MNNQNMYNIGIQIADEIIISIGPMPGKFNILYAEFVIAGVYLSGMASRKFLSNRFSMDVLVSTLLLRRDHFFNGNITELSLLSKDAFQDYSNKITHWPEYDQIEFCDNFLICLFARLKKLHNYTPTEYAMLNANKKLASIIVSTHNVYSTIHQDTNENTTLPAIEFKRVREDFFNYRKIMQESKFIENYYPIALLTAVLASGLINFIFYNLTFSW